MRRKHLKTRDILKFKLIKLPSVVLFLFFWCNKIQFLLFLKTNFRKKIYYV